MRLHIKTFISADQTGLCILSLKIKDQPKAYSPRSERSAPGPSKTHFSQWPTPRPKFRCETARAVCKGHQASEVAESGNPQCPIYSPRPRIVPRLSADMVKGLRNRLAIFWGREAMFRRSCVVDNRAWHHCPLDGTCGSGERIAVPSTDGWQELNSATTDADTDVRALVAGEMVRDAGRGSMCLTRFG